MEQEKIIAFMAIHPNLTVSQIAQRLGIETIEVGTAQHNQTKKSLQNKRDQSQGWNIPGYRVDPRSWLTKGQFEKAIERIENGETGVYLKLKKEYRISTFYKQVLESYG